MTTLATSLLSGLILLSGAQLPPAPSSTQPQMAGSSPIHPGGQANDQAVERQSAPPGDLKAFVPATVSPEARAMLQAYDRDAKALTADITAPSPLARARLAVEKVGLWSSARVLDELRPVVVSERLGGVPVFRVEPKSFRSDGTVLVYVHGGGFVVGSARSSLDAAALLADSSGKRVISVDYTTAPEGDWRLVTGQVLGVYKALLDQSVSSKNIILVGDSAGGDIVAGSTLKLRDAGLPMPAGLLLRSPVTDLTGAGDTPVTLAPADPAVHVASLRAGYNAYAKPSEQRDPYVSPVYGNFSEGFPPVLIQGGTRELLLSDFVRLHRAIVDQGGSSDLDLYEGMTHVFQVHTAQAPEGLAATRRARAFIDVCLARGRSASMNRRSAHQAKRR